MTVLLVIDSFDMEGLSSTTAIVCSVVGVNDIEEGEGDDSDEELFWDGLLLYSVDNSMYLDVQIIHYKNIRYMSPYVNTPMEIQFYLQGKIVRVDKKDGSILYKIICSSSAKVIICLHVTCDVLVKSVKYVYFLCYIASLPDQLSISFK